MKIRIKGNSIRYRLTKSEVAQFEQTGLVEESTQIGEHTLHYALQKGDTPTLTAKYETNKITLNLSAAWADEWIKTERVGFEHTMPLPNGEGLYLLVEKDFVCLDGTTEDQSDNYPNPMAEFHK